MKTALLSGLVAAALLGAGSLHAQADSVFAVNSGGATLLRLNSDASFVVRGVAGTGSVPATGLGERMIWFPGRYAFRAGRLVSTLEDGNGTTYWDEGNIGEGSAAFGLNTRARGANSFAAGRTSQANGSNTLAFNGTASGSGAVAIGNGAQATGDDAIALGPSSIAGGLVSTVIGPSIANGNFAIAIGLQNSASGQFSVAIGKNARTANRQGSVVLGDGCAGFSSDSVYPTANNQFVARGCGGIRFFTSQNLSSGVEVAAGGGSWSSISDRNRKENFLSIESESVLARLRAVPVTTWNYKTQDRSIRHIGPMAQDLYAAFGVGESNLLINTVDIDGINLAAVKELDERSVAQQARITELEARNRELEARLARLEALLSAQR
ncbi:MAG TPA: tail fiber domain-containing protein [Longimicrobium sp.]|jgi:hypothetical protein